MTNTLDILLNADILPPETKQIKIKRLSRNGEPVIFTLRSLSYNRVAELKKMDTGDTGVHILLAGVTEPDFKDPRLLEKYSAATPADLIKKLLSPGEIDDIEREIERLSGYLIRTIEDVKKK